MYFLIGQKRQKIRSLTGTTGSREVKPIASPSYNHADGSRRETDKEHGMDILKMIYKQAYLHAQQKHQSECREMRQYLGKCLFKRSSVRILLHTHLFGSRISDQLIVTMRIICHLLSRLHFQAFSVFASTV